jgi:hypothetical protein
LCLWFESVSGFRSNRPQLLDPVRFYRCCAIPFGRCFSGQLAQAPEFSSVLLGVSLSCLGSAEISRSREIAGRFLFFRRQFGWPGFDSFVRHQVSFWFIHDLSLRQVICRRWFWLWCCSWPLIQGAIFFSRPLQILPSFSLFYFSSSRPGAARSPHRKVPVFHY